MTEEMLINGLALIGAGTVLYGAIRLLAAVSAWAQRVGNVDSQQPSAAPSPAPRPSVQPQPQPQAATASTDAPSVISPDQIPEEVVAVIAAAVHSTLESHRIVHIQDPHTGMSWSAEGRWLHQTSHRTH